MARHETSQPSVPINSVDFAEITPPEFGNPLDPADANKQFADYLRKLDRAQLVLCAGQYACMAASEAPRAGFSDVPEFGEGRERSRHGVRFGKLDIQTEQDPRITTFVALKPYDKRKIDLKMRPEQAVTHDWATNSYLRSISKSGAYEPLGVWRNQDTFFVPGLVTHFNERSLSLDNMLQAEDEKSLALSPARAERVLHLGHFGLGVAHGARITHGDALPQNFATDGAHIIFNDTTTLRPFGKRDEVTAEKLVEDLDDFSSGALHPEMASVQMRALVSDALRDVATRDLLYESYTAGAVLGAERAGYPKSGLLVSQDAHNLILDRVIQKYAPK
jgi:hypothetical protein